MCPDITNVPGMGGVLKTSGEGPLSWEFRGGVVIALGEAH